MKMNLIIFLILTLIGYSCGASVGIQMGTAHSTRIYSQELGSQANFGGIIGGDDDWNSADQEIVTVQIPNKGSNSGFSQLRQGNVGLHEEYPNSAITSNFVPTISVGKFKGFTSMDTHAANQFAQPSRDGLLSMGSLGYPSHNALAVSEGICTYGRGGLQAGLCVTDRECQKGNGDKVGICNYVAGQPVSVCCAYRSYCGYETNNDVVHLRNPEFPMKTNGSSNCQLRLRLLPATIQLRVDFLLLDMKPMESGVCDPENSLKIESIQGSHRLPTKEFCGNISGTIKMEEFSYKHVYLHYDIDPRTLEPGATLDTFVSLKFAVKNFASRWHLKISQLSKEDYQLLAPTGCSQYYMSDSGTVTNLNWADNSYQTDISQSHCIRYNAKACGISYKLSSLQLASSKASSNQIGYGLTCKDYLSFNGQKSCICGSAQEKELTFPVHGTQGFWFRSDSNSSDKDVGFLLQYSYLEDCKDVAFYKFPVPGASSKITA